MSQMNPKEAFHNIAYSVQLPYIDGRSLPLKKNKKARNHVHSESIFIYKET